MLHKTAALVLLAALAGCGREEPRPSFPVNRLPADCQTLIRQGSDAFRDQRATAEQVIYAIDKHCGPEGVMPWKAR